MNTSPGTSWPKISREWSIQPLNTWTDESSFNILRALLYMLPPGRAYYFRRDIDIPGGRHALADGAIYDLQETFLRDTKK